MLPALSEPVALPPGSAVRIERVSQLADDPVPERFLHFHGPAELVLITAGSGTLLSDAGAIPFTSGTLLYVPSMAVHDFAFDRGERGWTLIQFDPFVAGQQVVTLPAIASVALLEDDPGNRTSALIDWLGSCHDSGAPDQEMAVVLQALLLSLKGLITAASTVEPAVPKQLSRFRPLLDHWMGKPQHVLDLTEAASLCSLSPAYFSRQFKQLMGCGFIAYQMQLRMRQAARMIANTDHPISRIAYRLGFQSPAYFSQCYRAEFGVAPSSHRKAAVARRIGRNLPG